MKLGKKKKLGKNSSEPGTSAETGTGTPVARATTNNHNEHFKDPVVDSDESLWGKKKLGKTR